MESVQLIRGTIAILRKTISRVKGNKEQLNRLDKRIQNIQTSILQVKNVFIVQSTLQGLKDTLENCEKFLDELIDANRFNRLFHHSTYHKKFKELNKQLTQDASDLQLALMVSVRPHFQNDRNYLNQLPGVNESLATRSASVKLSTYIIKSGDTFCKLSQQYGCSLNSILDANPGIIPECLYIGQAVNVPIDSEPHVYINEGITMENKTRKQFYEGIIAQSQCNDMALCDMGLTDEDWPIIIEKATQERQCTSLFLNNNKITSIVKLVDELSNNTTLTTISLGGNPIKDDVSQLISKDNTTLVSLWLNETGLSNDIVERLCDALQTNSTLEGLYLHSNELVNDDCIDYIIKMLENNKTLKYLWLYNCKLTENGKKRLRVAVKKRNTKNKKHYCFVAC